MFLVVGLVVVLVSLRRNQRVEALAFINWNRRIHYVLKISYVVDCYPKM